MLKHDYISPLLCLHPNTPCLLGPSHDHRSHIVSFSLIIIHKYYMLSAFLLFVCMSTLKN